MSDVDSRIALIFALLNLLIAVLALGYFMQPLVSAALSLGLLS